MNPMMIQMMTQMAAAQGVTLPTAAAAASESPIKSVENSSDKKEESKDETSPTKKITIKGGGKGAKFNLAESFKQQAATGDIDLSMKSKFTSI